MAYLLIRDLRGGMNNSDSSVSLPEDQSVLAQNVEYVLSLLGERRLGTTAVTLPSFLSSKARVPFVFRHLPTSNIADAEFWALAVDTGSTVASLGRKTSTWQAEITISDTPDLTSQYQYLWQAVSIHGKIHFAYKSNQDRLHVWDGTTMRRSGMKAPTAAPTGANQGAGSFAGTRYYRVRFSELSGTKVLRRSEPSAVLTFAPSGTGSAVRVTKPATVSEGETHWELEASTDNINFYRIASTVVGTTFVDDSTSFSTGYATTGILSEDIGDYALLGSARYLSHDNDRLIWAGSYEDETLAARVGWTPVFAASGVGNDERSETDTDPSKNLDTHQGGPITGLSEPILGGIWVFKQRGIYKLTRTNIRSSAYDSDKYTDAVGALHGSVISGVDETGQPCIYFLDPEAGPCRIGVGGIKRCGEDVRTTWSTINVNATAVVTSALFYPAKKQAIWCIATGAGNTPSTAIVLHTDKSRTLADGNRKGWVLWTGTRASALSMCLYADNIEANAARSRKLVPLIGLSGMGLVHRCDTGTTDNGTAYVGTIRTRPYTLGTVLQQFLVKSGALIAKAVANAAVTVKVLRDFMIETTSIVEDIPLSATGTETDVIKHLDDLEGSDLQVAQFEFTDPTTVLAQWRVDQFSVWEEKGQSR